MKNYAQHVSPKQTPQTEAVPGKNQIPNSAGGFTFALDDWKRLERFLILGSDGGTYYVKERELTQDNAAVVKRCAAVDPIRTVETISRISEQGRAPKNDPAIFALALCAADTGPHADQVRQLAYAALTAVCRTGTHLFQFVQAVDQLRGWGTALRRAVAAWYTSRDAGSLAYQVTKYQQRGGWSHRDVMRLSRPVPGDDPVRQIVFRWAVTGTLDGERTVTRGRDAKAKTTTFSKVDPTATPAPILALEQLKRATTVDEVVRLITTYGPNAPRELVPTQFLTDPKVWDALLVHMPLTAMLRNLGNMSKCGLLTPLSDASKLVAERLCNVERLKQARIHPLAVLVAMKTYAQGHGMKSDGAWTPVQAVVAALDAAFYMAFDAVEPTNKRWLFGLDVSGSMTSPIAGLPISCCEAATALSLVSTRIEPFTFTGRFNTGFEQVPFNSRTALADAMRYTANINGGGTDCAMPMMFATANRIPVDTFVVLTDSETYAGRMHPFQALNEYRQRMGIPAKMIVAGMTSTGFTIADPSDAGMMDVVGFDTAVPQVMADFARN